MDIMCCGSLNKVLLSVKFFLHFLVDTLLHLGTDAGSNQGLFYISLSLYLLLLSLTKTSQYPDNVVLVVSNSSYT